ncbi:hypothetical protein [Nonomuraea sediminis]|uniref:hypothetical protein n=1 Tax=Nonomuraea sediminis TaxID=2835864 RepID=UPI001BDC3A07|nr:hypothetical protein [Nonomuraea sediminis]
MTDNQRIKLTDQIIKAAQRGDIDTVDDLVQHLQDLARQEGKNDLLLDLWDAKEITEDGLEFAVQNNGCNDPRR